MALTPTLLPPPNTPLPPVPVCTLLDKRERRKVVFEADYVGFVCPDEFVVGECTGGEGSRCDAQDVVMASAPHLNRRAVQRGKTRGGSVVG